MITTMILTIVILIGQYNTRGILNYTYNMDSILNCRSNICSSNMGLTCMLPTASHSQSHVQYVSFYIQGGGDDPHSFGKDSAPRSAVTSRVKWGLISASTHLHKSGSQHTVSETVCWDPGLWGCLSLATRVDLFRTKQPRHLLKFSVSLGVEREGGSLQNSGCGYLTTLMKFRASKASSWLTLAWRRVISWSR